MNTDALPTTDHACRVCGAVMRPWRERWLGYVWGECTRCHSVQKLITPTEYASLNPTYDPGYGPDGADPSSLMRLMDVAGKERLLRKAFPGMRAGHLLDVGCGMGGFLLAAQRLDMDATGIEPSESHSRAAVEQFGLDVIHGYFAPDMVSRLFDVVVISHVIEHIYDPREFVRNLVSVLAPGGKLLVVTPNADALTARLLGRYWSMYKPVDHVTMLGKRALPHLIPQGATLQRAWTNEWPGEFLAHVISAARTWRRPQLGNQGGSSAQKPSVRQGTLSPVSRAVLALPSFPFRMLAKLLDRQSCLYAVITKGDWHEVHKA